jgi:hypothetical protein
MTPRLIPSFLQTEYAQATKSEYLKLDSIMSALKINIFIIILFIGKSKYKPPLQLEYLSSNSERIHLLYPSN